MPTQLGLEVTDQVRARMGRRAASLSPEEQRTLGEGIRPPEPEALQRVLVPSLVDEALAQYRATHARGIVVCDQGAGLQVWYVRADHQERLADVVDAATGEDLALVLQAYTPDHEAVLLILTTTKCQGVLADADGGLRSGGARPRPLRRNASLDAPAGLRDRLAGLPRLPQFVLEGTLHPLPVIAGETFEPAVALWIDPATHLIRASAMVDLRTSPDGGQSEALSTLVDALDSPLGFMPESAVPPIITDRVARPGLPARVRVDDDRLAFAVRGLLTPLGVKVERAASLPSLEEALTLLEATLRHAVPDDETPRSFSWPIQPKLLPPLFDAARAFARCAPWTYLLDHPPLTVTLGSAGPQTGITTLYASILGAGGQTFGVALYYTQTAVLRARGEDPTAPRADEQATEALIVRLRAMGVPVESYPEEELREMASRLAVEEPPGHEAPVDCLVVYLDPLQQCPPAYVAGWRRADCRSSRTPCPCSCARATATTRNRRSRGRSVHSRWRWRPCPASSISTAHGCGVSRTRGRLRHEYRLPRGRGRSSCSGQGR